MKITKFGHSCLLVEEGSARILIDPGIWSTIPDSIKNLDAILITHEHPDHLGIEWLQKNLPLNPSVVIFTNKGVGAKLAEQGIEYKLLEDGEKITVKGTSIEGFGRDHAIIYPPMPHWDNTGYLIADRLFHPGDSLHVPSKPVEILALPVCAPWSKVSEVVEYGKAVKPKVAFPIHDGMLKIMTGFHMWPGKFLEESSVRWLVPNEGEIMEF